MTTKDTPSAFPTKAESIDAMIDVAMSLDREGRTLISAANRLAETDPAVSALLRAKSDAYLSAHDFLRNAIRSELNDDPIQE